MTQRDYFEASSLARKRINLSCRLSYRTTNADKAYNVEEASSCLVKLEQSDMSIRYRAIMQLASMGRTVTPLLCAELHADALTPRMDGALEALKRIGDESTAEAVAMLLDAPDMAVRLAAVRTLRRLTVHPAIFKRALADTAWETRREAVFALSDLGRTGCEVSFKALGRALRDEHSRVRAAAANGLGRTGRPEAAQALRQLLRDEQAKVRAMAVWSLRHLGIRGAVKEIQSVLMDAKEESCEDVIHAARALGEFRTPQSVTSLVNALESVRSDVQLEIVYALGKIGNPEALPALETLVRTARPELRRAAAWSMAATGAAAVSPLRDILQDGDAAAKTAALFALGYMGMAQTAEYVYQSMQDDCKEVQQEAHAALERLKKA